MFWLLGDAPCKNPVCTSIVRTTDGGASFVGLPAPTAPLDTGSGGSGGSGGVNTIRFANALDGYVFGSNQEGPFWETHDGGELWTQPSAISGQGLLSFGTGAGYAFALVGTCPGGSCSNISLLRSPVSSDEWSPLNLPVPAGASIGAGMAVSGADVWVSLSASQPKQMLLASDDSGSTWTTYTSPCLSGLGGNLQATSASVLWAVCPTGMLAGLMRSTDGGANWQALTTATPLPNSVLLAPSSGTDAVLASAGQEQLELTTDGGTTWQKVSSPVTNGYWAWIGFTNASTGSALSSASSAPAGWPWPNGPLPEQLWRTSDAGTNWTGPLSIG